MWFDKKHIKKYKSIKLNNLHGYVLPHAGTKFSGNILSHTLRFKPTKQFNTILIIYLPANKSPNVGEHYHEYYVPFNTLKQFYPNKKYIGYNMTSPTNPDIKKLNKQTTLYVVSADFSHFLELQDAIKKENCSAHALMHKHMNQPCTTVVDDMRSFKHLYKLLPDISLQWVGRTRSRTDKGVGYLSFLLRDEPNLTDKHKKPDGFFVTAYDQTMTQRECLGNTMEWTPVLESELTDTVLKNAKTTSRLTGGRNTEIPITNYTVTYLYKAETKEFIRGWHAILKEALYLPDVFLENTYDNGTWFNSKHTKWKRGNRFRLTNTFKKLSKKAGGKYKQKLSKKKDLNYTLFYSEQIHKSIDKSTTESTI